MNRNPLTSPKRLGAGIITNAAIVTLGAAEGHSLWVDRKFLCQVRAAINNASPAGVKIRFAHPILPMNNDTPAIGVLRRATIDHDRVLADMHLAKSSRETPDGLGAYIMRLAEEDPGAFGLSIVFDRDGLAERKFTEAHSRSGEFRSPDEENTGNLPHCRLARLHAADVVDEPAATGGLFQGQSVAKDLDTLASYALGLTDKQPAATALDVHAAKIRGYVKTLLDRHNLQIRPATPKPNDPHAEARRIVAEYLAAFGPKGAEWFAAGKTREECARLLRRDLFGEMHAHTQRRK